jgi:hypothetical protein
LEAVATQYRFALRISPNPLEHPQSPEHWLNKVDFSQFQAMMPLPYYHRGSENIRLDPDTLHFKYVQMTAVQAGIPDMGVNMTRIALENTIKSVQFAYEPAEVPMLLNDLPDERPIALMINPEQWEAVQRQYPHLINKAQKVYDHKHMKIMSVYPDSIRNYVQEKIRKARLQTDTLHTRRRGRWMTASPAAFFIYQSYDSLAGADKIMYGTGAYEGRLSDTTWLLKQSLPQGAYTLSLWIYANQDMGMAHEISLFSYAPNGGIQTLGYHVRINKHLKTIVNNWAMFEVPFEVKTDGPVHVFLHKKNYNVPFYLDEVLVKPRALNLYRREAGWIGINNIWYNLE